jgi:hypothetical protein
MSTHKDDIEKLFSTKFERFEVKPSEGEWLSLSSKLSRMNFWKFSYSSLNVYSLVLLSALAGAAVWFGVANIHLTEKNHILRDSIRVYQEKVRTITLPSTDSSSIPFRKELPTDRKNEKISTTPSQVKKRIAGKEVDNSVKPEDKQAASTQSGKDSVRNAVPAPPGNDSIAKAPVRRVKKLVVVKPKTVVVKDTVNITRPSK